MFQAVQGSKDIAIIGYSGHSYVVADALQLVGYKIVGYLEKQKAMQDPYNLRYLGYEDDTLLGEIASTVHFALGIGDNIIRTQVAEKVRRNNGSIPTIIHPSAIVSENARIGEGTFIAGRAVINPLSHIGAFSIVNSGSVVEHECKLGYAVHVAPGAVLLGNVKVGDRSFIGGGSVIKQGTKIASDVVVGAGAVVVKDLLESGTYVGNPARKIS